jgi:FixJ family two-component response regulator
VVLLTGPHDAPMVLDEVGAVIWDLLGEPSAEDELVDRLTAAFGTDRSEVVEHLEPFLSELAVGGAVASW